MIEEIYYTEDQIRTKYNDLNLTHKNSILSSAIDYMQQYNGRSKIMCIALAMGYDNFEGERHTYFKSN